ncbi:thioredoxin-like [Impatiens glandulifera]|uniref:thioredoxin-like n=1 Tax=Impatiens glandulifera TaxID=253017 RepID=UPI001FB05CEC|nr:thioredoxin-like [Impatiens glandulifera]
MALENCLQVGRITATCRSVGLPPSHHSSSFKEKLLLPTNKKKFNFSKSSSLNLTPRSVPSTVCKAREAINEVQVVTDSSWDKLVLGSETPVLVDFWAPWCGPCRMIAPVIDELAKEYAGKLSCYKLNTDDSPNIATKYGIRSIPTVLFFKNGERKESIIGAVPKSTLTTTIEKYIDSS